MIQNILSNIDLIPILQIMWIDLILSGDNAIVIALACRGLPEHQKKIGMMFGVATAIILRIFFKVSKLQAFPRTDFIGNFFFLLKRK